MAYPSIEIRQNENPGVTFVPNDFIDRYMTKAPGEYVKVYLYLLRCLYDREVSFSFTNAAGRLDSSEGDIRRALFFWENAGLLSLERSADMITGISMCTADTAWRAEASSAASASGEAACAERIPDYPDSILRTFCAENDVRQVIFVIEQYLGRGMTHRELSCLYEWAKKLSFPADLMIELAEQCISDGCSDLSRMHERALEWSRAGIRTSAQALSFSKERKAAQSEQAAEDARCAKVCSALGISGRTLNTSEREHVLKWSGEWHFNDEMILEACRRTITNTHRASFEYTQTILQNWYRAGITDLSGVQAADASYHAAKKASASPRKPAGKDSSVQRRSRYGELELLTMASI